MMSWFRKKRLARARPDEQAFARVLAAFPVLARLDESRCKRLFQRTTEILAEKAFQGAGDLELTEDDVLIVATMAALPVIDLDIGWYRGFHTFIVYPGEFQADFEEVDGDGVVHRGRDLRAGEAWAWGPVVLGFDEVMASGRGEGYNVVVHELAHQIDQLNGDMDGFPPLHPDMDRQQWAEVFNRSFERLCHELDHDLEPSLDPYAAESPAEFFAVASEFHFDVPEWMAEHHPELHELLQRFYHPEG
jgi:MtfA peptidase